MRDELNENVLLGKIMDMFSLSILDSTSEERFLNRRAAPERVRYKGSLGRIDGERGSR